MRSFFGKLATIDSKDLTGREKLIIEYIKNNLESIVNSDMKIERLAQEVGIGYSAIYGLLKKLNINGYRDLSISLANDANNINVDVAKEDEKVANGYVSLIKQNYSIIEKKQIFETLQLINEAKRIFVVYWENNLLGAAKEFQSTLYEHDKEVFLLDNEWDQLNQRISSVTKEDLFIFYTKYGNSKHLEKALENINKYKGKIVFISGRMPSAKVLNLTDSVTTLIIESTEIHDSVHISQLVAFNYFNDLLTYHISNTKKPPEKGETGHAD